MLVRMSAAQQVASEFSWSIGTRLELPGHCSFPRLHWVDALRWFCSGIIATREETDDAGALNSFYGRFDAQRSCATLGARLFLK